MYEYSKLTQRSIEQLRHPLARRVELHEALRSTQERAREFARAGAPHGTLVVSRVQTGGRGRLGRRWGSPPGGLWMSLVLRPNLDLTAASRVTQTAAVGVAKTLRELGVPARIKWPNDLLVGGRKICGILAESSFQNAPVAPKRIRPAATARPLDSVALGVGLNANLDPEDLGVPDREVATLRSELGGDVDPLHLLSTLLTNLQTELARIRDFGAVLDDWRALNCTLGRHVKVQRFGVILEGLAVDLNPEGALLLQTGNGTFELFEGEVEHLER